MEIIVVGCRKKIKKENDLFALLQYYIEVPGKPNNLKKIYVF